MSAGPETLELARCTTCHHRFVPADGVCPRCASKSVEPYSVPALGTVLAATEVVYPAAGWPAPHRLVLVELAESVRVLATATDPLPTAGTVVALASAPGYFVATGAPPAEGRRGEGDSPRRRRSGASFEPPR